MAESTRSEQYLGIDCGGNKIAWTLFEESGKRLEEGVTPTPHDPEQFVLLLAKILRQYPVLTAGIGLPATLTSEHNKILTCTNVPEFNEMPLLELLAEHTDVPIIIENDARCALIGEVWLGSAQEMSSAVLLTLGTGVGGAVMQKGVVQPHPQDVSLEISRLVVDPLDAFPAISGRGTIEAFLGGKNLEDRFGISLAEYAARAHAGDLEAKELWEQISYYAHQCFRTIYDTYSCRNIVIAGVGFRDIDLYLGKEPPPCPVIGAHLGSAAGLYGAVRLAIDSNKSGLESEWN